MIKHPTAKELRLKPLDVNKALASIQAVYDAAELGPLNFKFRSPYNWHLLKARPTSLVYDKNVPGIDYPSKVTNEPETSA